MFSCYHIFKFVLASLSRQLDILNTNVISTALDLSTTELSFHSQWMLLHFKTLVHNSYIWRFSRNIIG